jgi:hypothetical protein
MRPWPAVLAALTIALASAGHAQVIPAGAPVTLGFDLLAVLKVAYYPVQVMAYCNKEVQQNTKYQTAGSNFLKRNQDLLLQIEQKAKAERISNDLRVQQDKDAYDAITKTVASQNDKVSYCGLIAQVIEGGQFDLAVRDDLKQQMKRIFPQ